MISSIDISTVPTAALDDFSILLREFGLQPLREEAYLVVGTRKRSFGWILHLSVVTPQFPKLFETILPILLDRNVPFKIPSSQNMVRLILDGHLGYEQVGKIISIYPNSDDEAVDLATILIKATQGYKGPRVPTDAHLGSIVYTRAGAHTPEKIVETSGKKNRYWRDNKGQLVLDSYDIPFRPGKKLSWPFTALAKPEGMRSKKILRHRCNALSVIKADARGEVIKGIYLKSLFHVKNCIIKEGRKHMTFDEFGRDMTDRLSWQERVHRTLRPIIPLPEIYDFFEDDGDAYLVMEFIHGISLFDFTQAMRGNARGWLDFNNGEKRLILSQLSKILVCIQKLHDTGYVHRDITPVNFLINENQEIILIDIELAYSINDKYPNPPFGFGTPGFVSPEQAEMKQPTIKEDIFGIGATLLQSTTGLSPIKFDASDAGRLEDNIYLFLSYRPIAHIIALSLSDQPNDRPTVQTIQTAIQDYLIVLDQSNTCSPETNPRLPSSTLMEATISNSLPSILEPPTALLNELWASKTIQGPETIVNDRKTYTLYTGLFEGVAGTLYVLARCAHHGINIGDCLEAYRHGWHYIQQELQKSHSSLQGGLYRGTAGVPLALAAGLRAGLVEWTPMTEAFMHDCLTKPLTEPSLASGIAGQGLAILLCKDILGPENSQHLVSPLIESILKQQQKNGMWSVFSQQTNHKQTPHLEQPHHVAGILWFLIEYYNCYHDHKAKAASDRGILSIIEITDNLRLLFHPTKQSNLAPIDQQNEESAQFSILALFIKYFELSKDQRIRSMVEDTLRQIPPFIVNNNFAQASGLSSLGELYLNAYQAFGTPEWMDRASWICQVLLNAKITNASGHHFWRLAETNTVTANFMTGTSGIIHFLLRFHRYPNLGYRLLT